MTSGIVKSISIDGEEFDVTDEVSEWPGDGNGDPIDLHRERIATWLHTISPFCDTESMSEADIARQLHEMLWTEQDRIDAERRSEMRHMRAHAINSMCAACVKKEGD